APGGKGGNQAVQMSRLGADVSFIGKTGDDSNGRTLTDACRSAGVDLSYMLTDKVTPSSCSVVIVEQKDGCSAQNRIVVYPGANMTIRPDETEFIKNIIKEYDMLVLQMEIPTEIDTQLSGYAREAGVPVMLNSAPYSTIPEELLKNLTYISPNETEAEEMTGIRIGCDGENVNLEIVSKAAKKISEMGVPNVLITLGAAGVFMLEGREEIYEPCVKGITAVDPTAAGDSFVGAFCFAVCRGDSSREALKFANRVAAVTVSGKGAMPSLPDMDKLNNFYRDHAEEGA
ncbi:MAG: ribokinase, partial [Candidatus Limivicinus sp.]